ncbi:MAG: hypothetical protein ABIY70_09420 [Capsulimonas sp.]|uniref:hypothetical protein n=1 Tax=Capsulimonas sp. TaxID=2494211 RepID=UPI0032651A80
MEVEPFPRPAFLHRWMSTPLTQNYFWWTSLEAGEYQPTWTNNVDISSPGGNLSHVGPVLSGGSGPEMGVRTESSQSGKSSLLYSGSSQRGAAVHAYLKAFASTPTRKADRWRWIPGTTSQSI